MFRTRDQNNRDQRYSSVPETEGDGSGEWGNRLVLEPVKDDGRRTLTAAAPATSPTTGDRYIVGVNATGAWASLIGELVQYDGTWAEIAEQLTGAQVYSRKRDESLTIIETVGATIAPTLSPEVLSYATTSLKFWMPNSLVDSFYSNWKGRVASVTTASGSWATTMYQRYVVPVSDPTYSAFYKYIATYIADMNTHTGKWVFQPAAEGDLLYSEGDNNFYYFDGTSWVVLSSGNTAFYGAEGRQGADGLGTKELTAAVVDTYQPIDFDLSAITNLTYCPPSFFADAGDTFTIPRYGVYAVGYSGFRIQYTGDPPDQQIYLGIRINGTLVQEAMLPHADDFEGEAWHGIFELDLDDEVTFEFKTTGADWDSPFTILNGSNGFVYTVDAKGGNGELVPHALNDHTDTDFPSPTDGQVLSWDAGTSKWVAIDLPAAGPHLVLSSTHSDSVVTGSVTNGQFIKRVGGNWTNAAPPTFEELNDTTFTALASGDLAQWNGTAWVNIPASSLTGAHTLDSHSNVNTAGKVTGSNLRWNGSAWVVYTPTLAGLSDVSISGPVNGQGLVYSGGVWTNGNPTAALNVPYWGGYLSLLSPPTWTAYSTGGGTYSLNRVGGPSGWIFWTPPVPGTYEMIVTGSITFTPGGVNGSFGIYLSNTGAPLGQQGIIGQAPLGSMTIACHAVAYLSGNTMGFAMAAGSGGSIGAVYLNLTIKRIGD